MTSTNHPFGISQPDSPPRLSEYPSVHVDLVKMLLDRLEFGLRKYGVPLQPFNGRKALTDALDEVLDMAVYLLQEIEERKALELKLDSKSEEIACLQLSLVERDRKIEELTSLVISQQEIATIGRSGPLMGDAEIEKLAF